MCGIGEVLNNLFPTNWLDPYGCMPLNKEYSVQIDITQVETDDGIKVTAVKTPPRAGTTSIQDAISMALGMACDNCEAPTNSQQSADLGKYDDMINNDKKDSKPSSGSGKPDFGNKPTEKPDEEQDDEKKKKEDFDK